MVIGTTLMAEVGGGRWWCRPLPEWSHGAGTDGRRLGPRHHLCAEGLDLDLCVGGKLPEPLLAPIVGRFEVGVSVALFFPPWWMRQPLILIYQFVVSFALRER